MLLLQNPTGSIARIADAVVFLLYLEEFTYSCLKKLSRRKIPWPLEQAV